MIDAEIQDGQITKRYIFINLRAVALIAYDNEQNNSSYSDSTLGNKNAGYSHKSLENQGKVAKPLFGAQSMRPLARQRCRLGCLNQKVKLLKIALE